MLPGHDAGDGERAHQQGGEGAAAGEAAAHQGVGGRGADGDTDGGGDEGELQRGDEAAGELALFEAHRIEVVVSKNSGGSATGAKIEAARQRGLALADRLRDRRRAVEVARLAGRHVRARALGGILLGSRELRDVIGHAGSVERAASRGSATRLLRSPA